MDKKALLYAIVKTSVAREITKKGKPRSYQARMTFENLMNVSLKLSCHIY